MIMRVTDSTVVNMLTYELSPDQVRFLNSYCRSATTGELLVENLDKVLTFNLKEGGRIILPINELVMVTCTNTRSTTIGFDVNLESYRTLFKELKATPNVHYLLTLRKLLKCETPTIGFSSNPEVINK